MMGRCEGLFWGLKIVILGLEITWLISLGKKILAATSFETGNDVYWALRYQYRDLAASKCHDLETSIFLFGPST